MFSGIVEKKGVLKELRRVGAVRSMRIGLPGQWRAGILGESVAVYGVCLTISKRGKGWIECDLLRETLRRTNLGVLRAGDAVHLERALRWGNRLGGHFLLGHVDAVGRVRRIQKKGRDRVLTVSVPGGFNKFMIDKGCVGVDGVSLTPVSVRANYFDVHLIPHTLMHTTLGERKRGDMLNLEFDITAKYLWKWRRRAGRN